MVKRPHPYRVSNIGVWMDLLTGLTWMAAITNVLIFAFTSEQMAHLFPFLFELSVDSLKRHTPKKYMGRWVVGIIFAIEHVLLVVIRLIHYFVPDVPDDVR